MRTTNPLEPWGVADWT